MSVSTRQVSNLAGYAFLARTALATIARLKLRAERPTATIRPFTRHDKARLEQLQQLLDDSWSGAQLYGAAPSHSLTGINHEPTVYQRVESFDLVQKLVPVEERFATFVTRANDVLGKLGTGRWDEVQQSPDDEQFVEAELMPFLERLAHASELKIPDGRRSKVRAISTLV